MAREPKVTRELKFCGPWKGPDLEGTLPIFPWVASEWSHTQKLTHAAMACGPIWSCAFGPAVLHGCTPLL